MANVLDEFGREVLVFDAFAYNGNYEVKATGFRDTASAGQITNIDFAIGDEDRYINGLRLNLKNHAQNDTIGLQIVDKDNLLGLGANFVAKTFGINWNVDESSQDQGLSSFNYAGRIPAGLYIRLVYNSTGLLPVVVKLNALMHKKLA